MDWQTFLDAQGAQVADDGMVTMGDAAAAHAALASGAALVPLAHFGLVRFAGEETVAFLQGQLSSDVKLLGEDACQYSSYSTPKGRMLASFLVLRTGGEVYLQMPRALQSAIQKRLSMYVLRSKTRASDASGELLLLGLAGAKAGEMAKAAFGVLPEADFGVAQFDGGWLARLPSDRVLLGVPADLLPVWWDKLVAAGALPAGGDAWTLADIRAGIPWVLPATQEEFVPQMANMELIGAVSFKKGCYPGQEIVARTQYLGKLKRRTFHVRSDAPMQPGQAVFSPEMNGQASGIVALSAQSEAGWEALVVVQLSSVEYGLHLDSPEGPALSILPLPYSLSA